MRASFSDCCNGVLDITGEAGGAGLWVISVVSWFGFTYLVSQFGLVCLGLYLLGFPPRFRNNLFWCVQNTSYVKVNISTQNQSCLCIQHIFKTAVPQNLFHLHVPPHTGPLTKYIGRERPWFCALLLLLYYQSSQLAMPEQYNPRSASGLASEQRRWAAVWQWWMEVREDKHCMLVVEFLK